MTHATNNLHASTFNQHLNSKFTININSEQKAEIILVDINDMTQNNQEQGIISKQERFALLFHGPKEFVLEQKIYEIEHNIMGRFSLFLVPVGQTETATQYEAIFNRIMDQST